MIAPCGAAGTSVPWGNRANSRGHVLEVTDTAVNVVREARASQEIPDSYGLRVFAQADEQGEPALALAFAEEPSEGDQVIEQDGTEVYVAPEVAQPLADSVLDVDDTPEGPQFRLVPQESDEA